VATVTEINTTVFLTERTTAVTDEDTAETIWLMVLDDVIAVVDVPMAETILRACRNIVVPVDEMAETNLVVDLETVVPVLDKTEMSALIVREAIIEVVVRELIIALFRVDLKTRETVEPVATTNFPVKRTTAETVAEATVIDFKKSLEAAMIVVVRDEAKIDFRTLLNGVVMVDETADTILPVDLKIVEVVAVTADIT
jgi:hypothetical protein